MAILIFFQSKSMGYLSISFDLIPYLLTMFYIVFRRRQWHPTPVLLPEKSHGRRSLVGCSPWGCWGSDMTEWLHFHFSLSCIGEGNGNPLQCSCLENPRKGGAGWAAIYGVAQSRTRLKRLSSSSIDIARETYLLSRANYNRNLLELVIILFIWSLEQP